MSELKPCPFCASDDIQRGRAAIGNRPTFYTYCNACQAGTQGHPAREVSDDKWNRRAAAAAQRTDAVTLPELVVKWVNAFGVWKEAVGSYDIAVRARGRMDGATAEYLDMKTTERYEKAYRTGAYEALSSLLEAAQDDGEKS